MTTPIKQETKRPYRPSDGFCADVRCGLPADHPGPCQPDYEED